MKLITRFKNLLSKNRFIASYLQNRSVRLHVSLFTGLVINMFYIVFNGVSGIVYSSPWFVTVALYYVILVVVRYIILNVSRTGTKQDYIFRAYKASRRAGVLIFLLGIPTSVMILYTVTKSRVKNYSTLVIVILGIYTAFSILSTVLGLISGKKRGFHESAAYVIKLSAAMTSLFNLQTAILSDMNIDRQISLKMNFMTGVIVFLTVFISAIVTIVKSTRAINRIKSSNSIVENSIS